MAMMAIRGIYERHGVHVAESRHRLRHRRHRTAAADLRRKARAQGQDLPQLGAESAPDPDPGDREPAGSRACIASAAKSGMERYIAARPDVFFTGRDGSLRSNRVLCQLAGQYARRPVHRLDAADGRRRATRRPSRSDGSRASAARRTWATTRTAGGIRSEAWLELMQRDRPDRRAAASSSCRWSRPSRKAARRPFVDDARRGRRSAQEAGMPIAPVMIYGDDVSHVVTEEGIAYLYKAEGIEERRAALAAIAGVTRSACGDPARDRRAAASRGIVAYPEDLGVRRGEAKRSLLAARSIARSGRLVRAVSTTRRRASGAGRWRQCHSMRLARLRDSCQRHVRPRFRRRSSPATPRCA